MEIIAAVKAGDVSAVRELLGGDPGLLSATDENGDGLLHLAAWHRQAGVARLLLEAGIDPNARNSENRTALHNAFEVGSREVEALLEERGAEVDICLAAGYGDLDRLRELLDEDPELIYDLSTGLTPMEWAGFGNAGDSIRLLAEYGADVNFPHPSGRFTPLFPPAQTGNLKAGRALLELGADPDTTDERGNTPLHCTAAMTFSVDASEFAKLLLEHGADVNARNTAGLTPLGLLKMARASGDWEHPSAPPQYRKDFDRLEAVLREHGATE
jgi:cytohesin